MKMTKVTILVLTVLMLCLSVFALFVSASAEPIVGVKEGDWVEYSVAVSGTGSMPPDHSVSGMRMTVLSVHDASFFMNVTVNYVNGTVGSAVWTFNFTEGNTEGWIVIPANLSPGDTFFDSFKPGDVLVQREEQRVVLGATRTVTFGSDDIRKVKEWDKATGFFVNSVEVIQNRTIEGWYFENLTVNVRAIDTNMWSRQIFGLEPSVFALVISGLVFVLVLSVSALLIWQREKLAKLSLHCSLRVKRIVPVVIIVGIVIFSYIVVPVFWTGYGLKHVEVNLIMQSIWLSLILVSVLFRKSGNHFVHGFLMSAVVIATLLSFASVLVMWTPVDSANTTAVYFSSTGKLAELVVHGIFSIPALVFGAWFIALWRPNSATFPAKSKRIVRLLVVMWVLSYLAGVVGYVVDYTTLLVL
jgi:hypothetical protein